MSTDVAAEASASSTGQRTQASGSTATADNQHPRQGDKQGDSSKDDGLGEGGDSADAQEAIKETPEELRAQLDAIRRELAGNLQKKQAIDKSLASHESSIYAFETSYLSVDLGPGNANSSFGNIVRGYDAYLKSGSSAHTDSSRKKASSSSSRGGGPLGYGTAILGPGGALIQPINEEERLFSKSSTTYQDSLNLRDRDAGVMTASEGEDDDDAASGQGPAKKPKKK